MITLSHKPVIPMDLRCSATLITRRSQVQILPPPPIPKKPAMTGFFLCFNYTFEPINIKNLGLSNESK